MMAAESDANVESDMEPVLRKEAERVVMQKLRTLAIEGCGDEVRAFAECASGRMFSVAWKCREQNKATKACMAKFKSNEELKRELRRRHAKEFPRAIARYQEKLNADTS